MSAVDLSQLPPPDVIEALSFETILADLKADLISRAPDLESVLELESEPIVKLLQTAAYRELQLRARYNDEARALLLAYAVAADLDHIGATYYQGETRLVIEAGNPAAVPPIAPTLESDQDFRYRLSLKPESYSVAGPRDAYEFHARSADGSIKSVSVTSPIAGTTEVFVLTRVGNGVPDPAVLTAVETALNDESIRPLSEAVLVSAGAVVNYAIDVGLIVFPGPVAEVVRQSVIDALEAFADDSHRLDADIIRSAIDAAAHRTGVKKVVINSPAADVVCAAGQAPYCTAITVTINGVES